MDTLTHSSERNAYTPIGTADLESITVENHELQLAGKVREILCGVPQISPNCCIYRVPPRLRKDEKLYTPQRVSIGPLHHGKEELQDMEVHKLRHFQAFLDRTCVKLEDCIKAIIEWEDGARRCCEEKIVLDSDKLEQIFLVDSCFIIEAMLRAYRCILKQADQTNRQLLENQIPFFVIDGLFSLAFSSDEPVFDGLFSVPFSIYEPVIDGLFSVPFSIYEPDKLTLVHLSALYFSDLVLITDIRNLMLNLPASSEVNHFVDFLRICHLPSTPRLVTEETTTVLIPNAVELQNAGMNFKGCPTKRLLEIEYTRGMLEIPQINLNEYSEYVLRNIIALEQCHHPFDTYINDYIMFMDRLVDSAKDVDILVQSGVICNGLSDSTVAAALFNSLGFLPHLVSSKYYYWNISNQVNTYRNIPWNRWKAALKRDYLSNPWTIASPTAAVILRLLTLIQTICSLISL